MTEQNTAKKINTEPLWRKDLARLQADYAKNGYVIVDNFLPEEIAEEINALWKAETEWKKQDQVRPEHYQHVFKTNSQFFPGESEPYLARFDRADKLEKSARVKELYDTYFKPALSEVSGVPLSEFDIRCYRLEKGDFYRTHIDDYAGEVGLTYYVNKRWIWDWGGLLHIGAAHSDEEISSVLPKFNRGMILDHKKFRFPHFVSPVTEYAENPRYSIVSFNK